MRCPLCRADFSTQTPPRTPLSERTAHLPGFVSARSLAIGSGSFQGAVIHASLRTTSEQSRDEETATHSARVGATGTTSALSGVHLDPQTVSSYTACDQHPEAFSDAEPL